MFILLENSTFVGFVLCSCLWKSCHAPPPLCLLFVGRQSYRFGAIIQGGWCPFECLSPVHMAAQRLGLPGCYNDAGRECQP